MSLSSSSSSVSPPLLPPLPAPVSLSSTLPIADARLWQDCIAQALAHETPRPRDLAADPARWGVHHDDPSSYNRLLGAIDGWAWRGYDDAWVDLGGRRVQSVPGGYGTRAPGAR